LILFTLVHYLVAMSDDAVRFRKQAEQCREQAAKALSPLDKEAWLRVAEDGFGAISREQVGPPELARP
jgi:hypothetical protein